MGSLPEPARAAYLLDHNAIDNAELTRRVSDDVPPRAQSTYDPTRVADLRLVYAQSKLTVRETNCTWIGLGSSPSFPSQGSGRAQPRHGPSLGVGLSKSRYRMKVSRVHKSVLFSAAEKHLVQLFTMASMVLMARLLTPAETGFYLVAAGVLVLVEALRDFGVATYLIQQPRLSRGAVRTAFTVTFGLSLVLACMLYLAAGNIAALFGDQRLARLLQIGTLGLLLVPFATPILGLLRREMDFRALAVLNVGGAASAALVTVCLGVLGLGAASYVWGTIAGNAVSTVLAVRARPLLWIFRPSLGSWREVLSFGAVSSSVSVLNMAFDMLPRLALGRILGFDAVGLYGRALTLCQIPDRAIASALSPVVLPAFAARVRARGRPEGSLSAGCCPDHSGAVADPAAGGPTRGAARRRRPRGAVARGGTADARDGDRHHGARAGLPHFPAAGGRGSDP